MFIPLYGDAGTLSYRICGSDLFFNYFFGYVFYRLW